MGSRIPRSVLFFIIPALGPFILDSPAWVACLPDDPVCIDTKAQFEVASLEVIKMAGFRNASKSITEKMEALANAADEDKNGVIQWGEWYCVSDAIISAVEKAKVQSSRK